MLNTKNTERCDSAMCNVDQLQENACEFAEIAGRKLRSVVDNVSEDAEEFIGTGFRSIREHPVQSSIVGVAIGFILGKLLSR